MTEMAKKRLKGYLQTFLYMTVCGLLFVLGGGAFFIHESVTMSNHIHSNHHGNGDATNEVFQDSVDHQVSGNKTPNYTELTTASYAKELRIIGYVFLGVGSILILIGAPLAYQFWKRYNHVKEIERCPMLDPMYQKQLQKAYYTSPAGRPGLKTKNLSVEKELRPGDDYDKPKPKPKRSWLWWRQPSVTEETFSDLEPLSSSNAESEIATPTDSKNDVQQKSSSLFSRMFGSDLDPDTNLSNNGAYTNAALSSNDEGQDMSAKDTIATDLRHEDS